MALPASDPLTGTAGTPLSGNWTVNRGSIEIYPTGALSTAGAGTDSIAFWSGDTFSVDHVVEANLICGSLTAASVAARVSGSGATANAYMVQVYDNAATFELLKLVAGTYTTIHAFSETWTNGNGIRLSVSGTTLTTYMSVGGGAYAVIGGGSFTDADLSTGAPGIRLYTTGAVSNFLANNLGASAISASVYELTRRDTLTW